MKSIEIIAVAYAVGVTSPSYAGNVRKVKSGTATVAPVELYTSEACSRYAPVDHSLSQNIQAGAFAQDNHDCKVLRAASAAQRVQTRSL